VGGETTVRLGPGAPERGGRCQELALAAQTRCARKANVVTASLLLAAERWTRRQQRCGRRRRRRDDVGRDTRADRDPRHDLAEHRSFDALDAAGALLRTGLSGTNVGDIVVGIVNGRLVRRPRTRRA
jgi:hydroxypyruvate reductase